MLWIVWTVLAMVVITCGVCYAIIQRKTWDARVERWEQGGRLARDEPTNYARFGWALAGAFLLAWVLMTGAMMLRNVGQREVAIVYNFSGTISGKRDQGTKLIMPWEHIKKENVGIQHHEWVFDAENAAVSLDQQKVLARLAVNYQVDEAKVLDLYKRVGANWKAIIVDSRVPQVFKEVTATYQTQKITANRERLRIQTRQRLAKELAPYDIRVVDVFVTNLGFSQTYTDAIEAKQKQVQDAQRAEAKVREVRAEADQAVARAKGERDAAIARAQGDAQANRLRQKTLTPMLVQWEAIQKINPQAEVIFCPTGSTCIPNGNVVVANGKK